MFLCLCRGLTEADVLRAGRAGCITGAALIAEFGLDDETCCGRCAKNIEEFVKLVQDDRAATKRDVPNVTSP